MVLNGCHTNFMSHFLSFYRENTIDIVFIDIVIEYVRYICVLLREITPRSKFKLRIWKKNW